MTQEEIIQQLRKAFCDDDAACVRGFLEQHPDLKARINEPVAPFDSPAILAVRSREMLDVMLEAGADINTKSRWWAGGFGLLHTADAELATYAISRGAYVDAHAAARLGLLDRLRELIAADPALVSARGGDGQTPLHFANSVEIAEFLLAHGADIDARDVDHESTPAQWMLEKRHDVARYLVSRGCTTDILMAAALGDVNLVRKHLDADPDCIRLRVSDEHFTLIGGKIGGTIYQWTLGWYASAHQVAKKFNQEDVYKLLIEHSPDDVKFINACWLGENEAVSALLAARPTLAAELRQSDRRQLAHAARNNDLPAAHLMAAAGLPVDARSQHGATPLHWAAFHGNAELVELLLRRNPPLEVTDADFHGTPLGWAIYGSEHAWDCRAGDHARTVDLLLRAGAKPPPEESGTPDVRRVLRDRRPPT